MSLNPPFTDRMQDVVDVCECGHERLEHERIPVMVAVARGKCSHCRCRRFVEVSWASS